jgi:N-acetylmuramic acid 6-phosphate (MurNAc-6-P) etherase
VDLEQIPHCLWREEQAAGERLSASLPQPGHDDLVLGIPASGTGFFTRSALAFERSRGAFTMRLHKSEPADDAWFDLSSPL